MKNIIKNSIKFIIALSGVALTVVSCEYKQIADADYPEQVIYMPAATRGIFRINSVLIDTYSDPTPGNPFKFEVDLTGRKFNVPLAVYRAGINNDGAFNVDIAVNTDTITKLINSGVLSDAEILPSGKYTVASSVIMEDGKELAPFDLIVDLDFLRTNPGKNYAIGVGISSTQRKSNPKISTTVVVIDTRIMTPTADFTSAVDAANTKKINFANTSLNSLTWSWNFGDGSAVSALKTPSHTYAAAGTYTVTLTATGITGDPDKSIKTAVITIL